MLFSIIIVNYNLTNEVKNCLNSILSNFNKSAYEIILIDNNSSDKSINNLITYFKNILQDKFIFIQLTENIGFGGACNLASEKSKGDILFFLNPDTVVKFDLLQQISSKINNLNSNAGIIGLNVSKEKCIDFSAGMFPNLLIEFLNVISLGRFAEAFYIRLKSIISSSKILEVDWVMGSALFINKRLFQEVEKFDKDYFLYYEEMDLCKRVKLKGNSVLYLPDISVEHIGSASSKKNYYFFTKMFYKGKLLFLMKHTDGIRYNIFLILMKLHIYFQIVLWFTLKFKYYEKSIKKILAFKEILKYLSKPKMISNNSVSN